MLQNFLLQRNNKNNDKQYESDSLINGSTYYIGSALA